MQIVVIGGGIAGLYAGYLLKNEGYPVKVLEADNRYGGRIRSLEGFASYPLELGAEFIHGKYSLFYDFAQYLHKEPKLWKGKSYLYHKQKMLSEKKAWKSGLFGEYFDFFENYKKYKGKEQSVASYLSNKKFDVSFEDLLEVFAVEYGTSNDRLGMKSLAETERRWSSGKGDYKVQIPIQSLLQEFVDVLQDDLILESPVEKIEYANQQTAVSTPQQTYLADKVLVTVPLTMLKANNPQFSPDLPPDKKEAIEVLGMDTGMKIFLKFGARFWKKKMAELYGAPLCPLYYTPFSHKENKQHVLIGYVTGKKAKNLAQKGNSMVEQIVKELDVIFGNKVASKNLEGAYVIDWGKEPYIRGMYSYDPPHSEGMREVLATPVDGKVFFAGEATNYNGHPSTLQGAMESAERAFTEILESY